jgi:hypothetical protein
MAPRFFIVSALTAVALCYPHGGNTTYHFIILFDNEAKLRAIRCDTELVSSD